MSRALVLSLALLGCTGSTFSAAELRVDVGEGGQPPVAPTAGTGGTPPQGGTVGVMPAVGGGTAGDAPGGRGGDCFDERSGCASGVGGADPYAGSGGAEQGGTAGGGGSAAEMSSVAGGVGAAGAGGSVAGMSPVAGQGGTAGTLAGMGGASGAGSGGDAGVAMTAGAGGSVAACVQHRWLCYGYDCEDLDPPWPVCSGQGCPIDAEVCRIRQATCPGWVDVLVPDGWSAVVIGQTVNAEDCAGEPGGLATCRMVTANGQDEVLTLQTGTWKVYFAPAGTRVVRGTDCPTYSASGELWSCAIPRDELMSCRLPRPYSYPEAYPEP